MPLYLKLRHWSFDLLVAVEASQGRMKIIGIHPLGTMTAHEK